MDAPSGTKLQTIFVDDESGLLRFTEYPVERHAPDSTVARWISAAYVIVHACKPSLLHVLAGDISEQVLAKSGSPLIGNRLSASSSATGRANDQRN